MPKVKKKKKFGTPISGLICQCLAWIFHFSEKNQFMVHKICLKYKIQGCMFRF